MAQVQVRHDAGLGQEIIRMQIAQRGELHRAAQVKRLLLKLVRNIRDNHFAQIISAGTIQDEAKRSLGIMLAYENDGALKKRATQLSAIEQLLAFKELWRVRHCHAVKCPSFFCFWQQVSFSGSA